MNLYITINIKEGNDEANKFLRPRICKRGGSITYPAYSLHIEKGEFEKIISALSHYGEFDLFIHQIYFDF